VIVNRDLNKSFARLRAILTAERLKRVQRSDLDGFVAQLLSDLKQAAP
jgi:guanylate kinase